MGRQVVTGKYLPMFRRKLQMEAADCSEMLVNIYQTTGQHLPGEGNLYNHQWENLKSHVGR
jgi:hypothetical protein